MKRSLITIALTVVVVTSCADKHMTENNDGSYTVSTQQLGEEVYGYAGVVPLKVTFVNDTVLSVLLLDNQETPSYNEIINNSLLPLYVNRPISTLSEVDAISGATYTSDAVKQNLDLAVEYYKSER